VYWPKRRCHEVRQPGEVDESDRDQREKSRGRTRGLIRRIPGGLREPQCVREVGMKQSDVQHVGSYRAFVLRTSSWVGAWRHFCSLSCLVNSHNVIKGLTSRVVQPIDLGRGHRPRFSAAGSGNAPTVKVWLDLEINSHRERVQDKLRVLSFARPSLVNRALLLLLYSFVCSMSTATRSTPPPSYSGHNSRRDNQSVTSTHSSSSSSSRNIRSNAHVSTITFTFMAGSPGL
jgi:hypothetical protein